MHLGLYHLELGFAVQFLNQDVFVKVENLCASLGDHLKTLMYTWGWPSVTLVAHFNAYGCLSLETYLYDRFLVGVCNEGGEHWYAHLYLPFIVFDELFRSALCALCGTLECEWVWRPWLLELSLWEPFLGQSSQCATSLGPWWVPWTMLLPSLRCTWVKVSTNFA